MTGIHSPRCLVVKRFVIALGVVLIDEYSDAAVHFTGLGQRDLN